MPVLRCLEAHLARQGGRVMRISVMVDGVRYDDEVEPRLLLVHYLREQAGRTGTPIGCDTSNCGACTVLLNGRSVKSCSVLAVQADGSEVTTIQGLANGPGELHPLQQAFHEEHALQCGYCTPGMIMAAADLLSENPSPNEEGRRPADHRADQLDRQHHAPGHGACLVPAQPARARADRLRRRVRGP